MARKKNPAPQEPLEIEQTDPTNVLGPDTVLSDIDGKAPKEINLETPKDNNNLAPAVSKEEIEASIQEKLSRKTDKQEVDPFVPGLQLDNEVKDIANKKGFPLSRGTEIGARLMARSNRVN